MKGAVSSLILGILWIGHHSWKALIPSISKSILMVGLAQLLGPQKRASPVVRRYFTALRRYFAATSPCFAVGLQGYISGVKSSP